MTAFRRQVSRRALWQAVGATAVFSSLSAEAKTLVPSTARSRNAVQDASSRLKPKLELSGHQLGNPVFVRILKQESSLQVYLKPVGASTFSLFARYPICAFSGDLGPKTRQGDNQAPEGFYQVPPGMMNPASSFHLSFNLGYPNAFDRAQGYTGSALMVHGNCVSIGCYAMGDAAIEELWTLMSSAYEAGQSAVKVHCFPFAMTAERLRREETSPHFPFWQQLQPGYAAFEATHIPPLIRVVKGRYVVTAINP